MLDAGIVRVCFVFVCSLLITKKIKKKKKSFKLHKIRSFLLVMLLLLVYYSLRCCYFVILCYLFYLCWCKLALFYVFGD